MAALPLAVIALDAQNCVVDLNPAAEDALMSGREQAIGRDLEFFWGADSPLFPAIRAVRSHGAPIQVHELIPRHPALDAGPQTALVAISGEGGGVLICLLPPSPQARLVSGRLRQNQARGLSTFARMLGHEVKNPLAGIRGAAQLLEQALDAEEDRDLAVLIREQTDRVTETVEAMDPLARDMPEPKMAVNVHEILGSAVRLARASYGRDVRIMEDYDPSLPPIYGDRGAMAQILANLIKNACEAAPEVSGIVRIQSRYEQGLKLREPGGGELLHLPLTIRIRDNGGGIAPHIADQLFHSLVSTKREGRGLGLAYVAMAVADMGGLIEFETAPGATVFCVRLPVVSDSFPGLSPEVSLA